MKAWQQFFGTTGIVGTGLGGGNVTSPKMGGTRILSRAYTAIRADFAAEAKGALGDHIIFGPIHTTLNFTLHYGRYGIEVLTESLSDNESRSWAVISPGADRYGSELSVECKKSRHPDAVALHNEVAALSTR